MKEYNRIEAAYYDYFSTGLAGDMAFYLQEAQEAGSPVLELGCGTGRILIPIAEAGIDIVGLDLAPEMLAIARDKIVSLDTETQQRISLVEGDMRDFSLDQRFSLAIIPYRALQHLMTVRDQKEALHCIRLHLQDDGLLIFNLFDPRLDVIVVHGGSLGPAMKKVDEFVHPETGRHVLVWDTRQYNPGEQTLDQYFIFEELDQEGTVIKKTYVPLRLRYLFRYEAQHLLELCGYRVEALYGDFGRGPYRYGGEQIWVARKV